MPLEAPSGQKMPLAQFWHTFAAVAPIADEYVPPAQGKHADAEVWPAAAVM